MAVQDAGPSKLVSKKEKVVNIQNDAVENVEVEKKKKSKKQKIVEVVAEVHPETKVKVNKIIKFLK